MADQNQAAGPTDAVRAAAEQSTMDRLEKAADSITLDAPEDKPAKAAPAADTDTDPAPEPEEIETDDREADPEGDADPAGEVEQPEATDATKPDAAKPQGDSFTPEEELLLRRTKATPEDVEYFRGLTVAQRNRALNTLRNSVRETDRFFGMKPDERERAIEQARGSSSPQSGSEPRAGTAAPKLDLDKAKVAEVAKDLGIAPEAAEKLLGLVLDPIRQHEATREQERHAASQQQWMSQVESAAKAAHSEHAKVFPKLSDPAVFRALLDEDETSGVFYAKVNRGMDVKQAMSEAVRERATVKYLPEFQAQRKTERAAAGVKAVKSTAEPTGKSGRPAVKQARPASLDEAHDAVVADMNV